MDFLFNPKNVAVIVASGKKGKIGYEIMNSLINTGAKIFPINPNEKEIMGRICYPSLLDIEENIDLMVISLSANQVINVIEEGCKKGVKGAVIISGGFAEMGEEGKRLQDKIVEMVRGCGMRVVGVLRFNVNRIIIEKDNFVFYLFRLMLLTFIRVRYNF